MAGKITADKLREVLCEHLISATVRGKGGEEILIEPRLYFSLSDESDTVARGFTITVNGKEQKYDNFGELKEALSSSGAGENDYELIELDNGMKTVEELDEAVAFDNISMKDLLAKYPQADKFELVLPCSEIAVIEEAADTESGLADIQPLINAVISIKQTFSWHCTTSSEAASVLKFKLTDGARQWLLAHNNDYDLGKFEDLALYDGDRLLFSSCTHEHFHVDCEK